jgi:TRAP-type C4-dicarboxylate transport system permease small subunit
VIERLLSLLERIAMNTARLFAAAIVIILAAQIFFRTVLNRSLIWSEEVATWCMIWVVFMGSAALMRHWEHVHIPMFIKMLPIMLRIPLIVFSRVVTLICVLFLTYYGVKVFAGSFHMVSQTTGLSTRWIKLSVPIGMAMMSLFAASLIARDVHSWIRGDIGHFRKYGVIEPEAVLSVGPARSNVGEGLRATTLSGPE